MLACSRDILGRCAKQVVALGASVRARRSRNWLMGWRCASRPGRSGRYSAQKPASNGLARCSDYGQTNQLSHVIVCLSGSSDRGPAERRAVRRGRVTGHEPLYRIQSFATHCANRERPPPMLCRPGRRAGLGWIDTIGPHIGVSRISACRDPLFGGLNRYSRFCEVPSQARPTCVRFRLSPY